MMSVGTAFRPPRLRWPSRIAVRLLAFNVLLLFVPVAGILSLDAYENRLLESQERAMVQQGRLLAAALSAADDDDPARTMRLLTRLSERGDARLRVYDAQGLLVADSNRLRYAGDTTGTTEASTSAGSTRLRLLYRIGAFAATLRHTAMWTLDRLRRHDPPTIGGAEPTGTPPEVAAALSGRYRAATRPTPGQRSLTLYAAVPVQRENVVVGAVLVSQTTFRVLQALYDVRLRIFAVVIASFMAAALLTALAAATVVRPLGRLRREATDLAERRNRLPGRFHDVQRLDELGDLARALEELTRRLDEHIRGVERFASDVSHEFKNPLAAIRTASEMAAQADRVEDRQRFLDMITRDVDRLERLVSDVRELARIDRELEQEPLAAVDAASLMSRVIDGLQLAHPALPAVVLNVEGHPRVLASADRLAQAFENVLANARSFAPAGTTVEVGVAETASQCRITVADRGPGIPAAHLDRVFERFFTYRPDEEGRRDHAGLGLAIARTVIQGYGGTIAANNRPGGGASFEITLPSAAA